MNLQDSDLIKEKKKKGCLLFHYLESMQDRPPIELLVMALGQLLVPRNLPEICANRTIKARKPEGNSSDYSICP